jgi:N utilization substance protein B
LSINRPVRGVKVSRRAAREKALQALYEVEVGGSGLEEALDNTISGRELEGDSRRFARTLLISAWENREASDGLIGKYARDWKLERLAVIDRNILRMAIAEMQDSDNTPHEIAINEAVELAKLYSGNKSAAFINAILDNISKELKEKA